MNSGCLLGLVILVLVVVAIVIFARWIEKMDRKAKR